MPSRTPALKTDELASHTIIAPVRVTKRGVEQRLVIGGDVITSVQRDETLVKAIARAYASTRSIRTERVTDITDIARAASKILCPAAPAARLSGAEDRAWDPRRETAGRSNPQTAHVSDRLGAGLVGTVPTAAVRYLSRARCAAEIPITSRCKGRGALPNCQPVLSLWRRRWQSAGIIPRRRPVFGRRESPIGVGHEFYQLFARHADRRPPGAGDWLAVGGSLWRTSLPGEIPCSAGNYREFRQKQTFLGRTVAAKNSVNTRR